MGTASANDQGDARNARWGREGNARSDRGEAGVANWGHLWHAWNNAAWSSASEDEEHAWNNAAWWQAPAYPQRWTWSASQDEQDRPEANASSSVAQRKAPAVLRQRAVPDEPHSTIPDTAFLLVFNVSLLLLNGIQDYFGLDYIAKHKVHRLKNVRIFRKRGMLKRIYQQMVDLSGPFSMSWNEWANAFVVHRVMQTELDYLCDSKSLSCSHMRSCNLDVETRAEIVGFAMRSWSSYRFDAMTKLDEKLEEEFWHGQRQ